MKFFIATLLLIVTAKAENLTIGWAIKDPYQKETQEGLTGLDIQLVRHILEKTNLEPKFVNLSWTEQLEALKEKKLDVVMGAVQDEALDTRFRYSQPYRYEQQSLFYLQDLPKNPRIGVIRLSLIPDLTMLGEVRQIKEYETVSHLFEALQEGSIDGFVIDQIAGGTFVWEQGLSNIVKYKSLHQRLPVYLIFSDSISENTINKINQAITSFRQTENYNAIYRKYHQPILLAQTINQPWFFIIDIIGTIAFAISGVIIAYRERMTIFGAFFMALLPAVGGGIIRDLIVGRRPVFIVANRYYLYSVILTVIVALIFIKLFAHRQKFPKKQLVDTLELFDALGLASFAIIGVWVAFMKNAQPLWMWGPLLGVLTAAGGGIVRDLFRSDNYYTSLKGEIYPEIAIFWASCLTFFMLWQLDRLTLDQVFWAVVICMVGGFVMRIYVYKKGWKSPIINLVK